MYVAAARLALRIDHSHSLKEKRAVIRRIKARVQERLHVALSEVGSLDVWQRAELGAAVVSGDRSKANEVLDAVVRMLSEEPACELLAQRRELIRLDAGDDLTTEVTTGPKMERPSERSERGPSPLDTTFSPPAHWLAAEDES